MADSEIWGPDFARLAAPAATDRIIAATSAGAGGYSERGEFVWKDAAGAYNANGLVIVEHAGAGSPSLLVSNTSWDRTLQFSANASGYRINSQGWSDASARGLSLATGGADRVTIDGSGLVGVGVTPAARLHVKSAGEIMRFETATARGSGNAHLDIYDPSGRKCYLGYAGDDSLQLINELVGELQFGTSSSSYWNITTSGHWRPTYDNTQDFGTASFRGRNIYLVNSPTVTSDAEEKEWLGCGFTEDELRAAKRIGAEIGSYRWLASIAVEENGGDAARIHVGVRAQAVWAIMADEGLIDPIVDGERPSSKYGFLCYDEREAVEAVEELRDDDDNIIRAGVEARPAGSRFGIRPDQLALFLIAAHEVRLAAIEAAL